MEVSSWLQVRLLRDSAQLEIQYRRIGLLRGRLVQHLETKIVKFALCSAVGQSFIFYTISNFDSLVCTTVTTTRKVFSVLLSIFLNGHKLSSQGWVGIGIASLGILSELQGKAH